MRLSSRVISMILALLITGGTCIGCAQTETETEKETQAPSQTETTAAETEPETDMNGRLNIKDDLPDGIDFNGVNFTVYASNDEKYMTGPEELTGDIIDDTVFNRNLAVSDRLNIKLNYFNDMTATQDNVDDKIKVYLAAGDTTFDLYLGQQYGFVNILLSGGLYNAYDLDHLNFNQPWWNQNYMDELSIGKDARYFLVSDYFISAMQRTHVLYFNKTMYANHFDNPDGLYEEVIEGTWTIDRLSEVASSMYIDKNGNGKTDDEDQLGYVTYLAMASVDPFMYTAGINYSSHNEDGDIELSLMDERAITLADKILGFFYQTGSSFTPVGDCATLFKNGSAMFLGIHNLINAEAFRDMEDDFGFLPYPKLEEEQENYHSLVADIVLIGAVPVTSLNLDKAGIIIEALSSESFRTVVPTWYETALKVKYSRDDISAQIIDIVHDSMTTDFIYAYSPLLFNIGVTMRDVVGRNQNIWVSELTKKNKATTRLLDKLIASYEENY